MRIGIDGSRAFIKNRTGIEEYSYQTIKHLRGKTQNHQVVLYLRKNQKVDFELPQNWNVKVIKWSRFWTQIGLSCELLANPIDALFIPAHTVPIIHPKNTVVTIHGLEYEFIKNGYSWWDKFYMSWSIKMSCKWASEIISVSENTKNDLVRLYKVSADKIKVVYEGYNMKHEALNMKQKKANCSIIHDLCSSPFLLFIGRIEDRKNIINIIKAFEILKEEYNIEPKLVLAGRPGYGYEEIKNNIQKSKYNNEIIELGFVSEEEKWQLLKNADVFVFPTKYEGFGIPILEAQSVGCPVVASNNSSIPEVVDDSAVLVDCGSCQRIAEGIHGLISNNNLKNAIIQKGLDNTKRFSWERCAQEIAEILLK